MAAPRIDAYEPEHAQEPLEERIRRRAYERYLDRADGPGSDVEDWLAAEREIAGRREDAEDDMDRAA